MSRPEGVRCERCCFWDEVPPARFKEVMGRDAPKGSRMGACRRFPKIPIGTTHIHFLAPIPSPDDWCGEFRETWSGEEPSPHVPVRTFTPAQFAARLHVSPETVRHWIKSGQLEGYRFGRSYRIPKEAVERFIAGRTERLNGS